MAGRPREVVAAGELPTRIWEKIQFDPFGGCWLWSGGQSGSNGAYGQTSDGKARHKVYAHIYVYERLIGPVPDGLELDHRCRVRLCVNPWHLDPVTHAQNMWRGLAGPTLYCTRGHEKVPSGIGLGMRCRACNTENKRRSRRALAA